MKKLLFLIFIGLFFTNCIKDKPKEVSPNLLFIIYDDASWEHFGCYGDIAVRTPSVDKIAEEGVRFEHAYCAAPSCSPSRAGIITGQDIARIEEGSVLTGFIRKKFDSFPLILQENGYQIGSTGKGYWPFTRGLDYAYEKPLGDNNYSVKHTQKVSEGISKNDYSASFDKFLSERDSQKPFFFWVGIGEPHLKYEEGLGLKFGLDTSQIRVPKFYPDEPEVRLALSEYLAEIEWGDKAIGNIVKSLDDRNLLDNTLIVVTSDNGMPYPKAKATLYEHGVRMPLVIKWDKKIKKGRVVTNPVSLVDMAPTFLELAGVEIPDQMNGRSITNLMFSEKSGDVDPEREFVVSAFEEHVICRRDSLGFPRRAIHTKDYTYIINYEPSRYPAGDPGYKVPNWDYWGDIDPSRLKKFITNNRQDKAMIPYFEMGFEKVPREQLFDKRKDPDNVNNLIGNPEYEGIRKELNKKLQEYMLKNEDPRAKGLSPWDKYNLDI